MYGFLAAIIFGGLIYLYYRATKYSKKGKHDEKPILNNYDNKVIKIDYTNNEIEFQKALNNLNEVKEGVASFVFIDFETTDIVNGSFGVPNNDVIDSYPHPVQVAILVTDKEGNVIDKFYNILKIPDDCIINPKAEKVHGISKEKTNIEGVDPKLMLDFLAKYLNPDMDVIAHNCQFDNFFIKITKKRLKYKLTKYALYCTMYASQKAVNIKYADSGRLKLPKLIELVKYSFFDSEYEFTDDSFNDAMFDVKACAACFFKLGYNIAPPQYDYYIY